MTDRTDRAAIYAMLKGGTAPATPDLSWNKAVRVHWLQLTTEERSAGWPDAFTVHNLACLQYPYEGNDTDKRRARKNQAALKDTVLQAIQSGSLAAEKHTAMQTVAPLIRRVHPPSDPFLAWRWGSDASDLLAARRAPQVAPATTREVTWYTISRAPFRDLLATAGEEPSEHIRAWLRPLEGEQAHQEKAAPAKPKRETQADRVEECLRQCERHAAHLGKPFDRWNMPGQKAQFLDLLRRFDPSFLKVKNSTLLGYVKEAQCRWSVGAKVNKDATALYLELFPREGRGVSPQRQSA